MMEHQFVSCVKCVANMVQRALLYAKKYDVTNRGRVFQSPRPVLDPLAATLTQVQSFRGQGRIAG